MKLVEFLPSCSSRLPAGKDYLPVTHPIGDLVGAKACMGNTTINIDMIMMMMMMIIKIIGLIIRFSSLFVYVTT
jgi:hypothetical protein